MANRDPTLDHPAIGHIRGVRSVRNSVTVDQFLGVQYAELVDGFARATMKDTYITPVQATAQGRVNNARIIEALRSWGWRSERWLIDPSNYHRPLPIGNPEACDHEHLLLQHSLPHPQYAFSDTQCLNLNVSVPSEEHDQRNNLPVVVFVHGGGFVTGSGSWPQWDLAGLVALSVEAEKPIVAVGINYRLGIPGFLTSAALRASGYLPNNGLHDQKLALRWVRKYIRGFGGNPEKVTFLGSSMGGAAGFIHLQSEEVLFSQLAALGGSGLIRPLPKEVLETVYGVLTKTLHIDGLSPALQVSQLVQLAGMEGVRTMLANAPGPINAVVDDDIVRATANYSVLSSVDTLKQFFPGAEWCKAIYMSDSRLDGMVFSVTALTGRYDNLCETLEKSLKEALGPDSPIVSTILSDYGINKFRPEVLPVANFLNDIGFRLPAKASAKAWAALRGDGARSHLVHFDVPNPWSGPWQGHASHALDLAFLLQNFNEYLGPGQRATAEQMGRDFIAFVHGESPFEPFGDERLARIYYAGINDGEAKTCDDTEDKRPVPVVPLEEIAEHRAEILDKLMNAMGRFLQGPF